MTYQEQALALSTSYGLGQQGISIKPIGNGHINTTLLLQSPSSSLVVQKLNTSVFPDIPNLVNNARLIEKHLTEKKQNAEYELSVIKHVATAEHNYYLTLNGENWRALEFIGGSYSQDVVENKQQARIAASAFGQFAKALDDFDAKQLVDVIPNFHNLAMRFNMFDDVIERNPCQRVVECAAEIEFCQSVRPLVNEVAKLEPKLPLRACHNDTKINNMLFCNKQDTAKAVIDLDTCMPGYWMYDFGDMVRTFCSPEEEDSTALDKVTVREEIFEAIVQGYVEPLKEVLTEAEKESFWLGAKVMCFMIGLRFLTDHLDGDNYFTIHHKNHNLERARNQFALYRELIRKETRLKQILFAA